MTQLASLEKPSGLLDRKVFNDGVKANIKENPLRLVAGAYLRIKTKAGQMLFLKLNSTQLKLITKIKELRAAGRRVRIWLLKYRQGGVSTLIEAIIYALTSQQENRNSLILADEKEHANNLFEMSKLYQERLEKEFPYLPPALKKSNEKKLEFEGTHSQIIIASAENTEAAKSHTFHYVHLSEVAYFRDLRTVLDDLNQTVPDLADTMIIGETTANGMEEFYRQWIRAIKGETDWIPLFFGWYEMLEYSMPLQNGELYPLTGILFDADTSILNFEQEERELKQEFSLTDQQLNWRRWAIVNKCQGKLDVFRREYPATWQEAFAMSGSMFFERKGLQKQIEKRPITIGELFYTNLKWEFRDLPHGRIKIYEKPDLSEQYVVASDASEALGSDEAAILVLNKRLNTTAAIVVGQYPPEDIAELDKALGYWYNTAMVAPENKGYGYMVCQLLNNSYGNIYKRMVTKTGGLEPTEELGWNTNAATRPEMLAQLGEEIAHNATTLNSKELIDECNTFIIKKDKEGKVTKVEAQEGSQDGLVICRAIAGMVRKQYPYKPSIVADRKIKEKTLVREAAQPMVRF